MSLPSNRVIWVMAALMLVGAGIVALKSRKSGASQAPVASVVAPKEGLALSAEALQKNPIASEKVVRVKLAGDLRVVGAVALNENHYAVVGPLVAGRVVKLRAGLGDVVRAGQVLAEIESAEVGQAQAAFLSASAKSGAADANQRRERELAALHISSARDKEVAEAQAMSETAEVRAAVERMKAYGLSAADVEAVRNGGGTGGRVALRAPIAGTVVARTITLGQSVERATDAFKIVNLQKLWVMLDLYEKDLGRVHIGQTVRLRTEALPGEVFEARVAYVNPIVDEKTRTANVRIEFDNPNGKLRPGQFVTANLIGDAKFASQEVGAVSRKSVATVEGKSLVFVKTAHGFEKRSVELGLSGGDLVEVKKGLTEGEEVATDGAFLLKSELLR
jgi:membrane fusion protein, heavy metal efflux system